MYLSVFRSRLCIIYFENAYRVWHHIFIANIHTLLQYIDIVYLSILDDSKTKSTLICQMHI